MINKRLKRLYESSPLGFKVFVKYITNFGIDWSQFIKVGDELLVLYAYGFVLEQNCCIIFDKEFYYVKANRDNTILAKNVGESIEFQYENVKLTGIYKSGIIDDTTKIILKVFEDFVEMIDFDIAQKAISKDLGVTTDNYNEDDLPF